MIDPIEAKEKFPLLDKNSFQAAIYSPADGTIDPVMLVNALTKSAERNGCKVLLYPFSSSSSSVSTTYTYLYNNKINFIFYNTV